MKIHSTLFAATAAFLLIAEPVAAIEFTDAELTTMEKKQTALLADIKSFDAMVGTLSSEEVEHLQSLMREKIQLDQTRLASRSNKLFAQKVQSYISSMNELNSRKAQQILNHDTARIQRAMLHKLENQRQNLADVI